MTALTSANVRGKYNNPPQQSLSNPPFGAALGTTRARLGGTRGRTNGGDDSKSVSLLTPALTEAVPLNSGARIQSM